jgi:hypothetical protein
LGSPEKDPKSGVILLRLPAGDHTVELFFSDPFATLKITSLVSAVLVLLFLAIPNFNALSRSFRKRRKIAC